MKKVITYGTFDLFHYGHMNILKRAKEYGDYLIVGVTSEDYDRSRGKLNVIQSLEERLSIIQQLPFVDEVIVEHHKDQKISDMKQYEIDFFVIGDDWKGKFDYLNDYTKVIYLPRTTGISSTLTREELEPIRIGIIGTGRIAKRFAAESKYVEGIQIHSVMSRSIDNVDTFVKDNNILYGFTTLAEFLESDIHAVYIATPHETHYEYAKYALLANKHVLCEKPVTLNQLHLLELCQLAKKSNLIFLEAIKTAFLPAFSKLLDELNNGVIGEVQEVRATFTKLYEQKNLREWLPPYGGATNELSTYPLFLAQKILGEFKSVQFFPVKENNIDSINRIIGEHENGKLSISTVGIGMKSEGCAIIAGTKAYIYIPAPWWLMKTFSIRFEDPNKELVYDYSFEGDGLRQEISEFNSLIRRNLTESSRLNHQEMLEINKVLNDFNDANRF